MPFEDATSQNKTKGARERRVKHQLVASLTIVRASPEFEHSQLSERPNSRGCGRATYQQATRDPQLAASSLDSLEFRHEVCFLCLPPSLLAVPHYTILAQLSVRTRTEPDVRS